MDKKEIVLDVNMRAFGEMVVEILNNEGISASLEAGDAITSALGSDKGNKDWKIIVPHECIERARQIISELEQAGELAEFEISNGYGIPSHDIGLDDDPDFVDDFDDELI